MASAKIRTVLGDIRPHDLGFALVHEHMTITYGPPANAAKHREHLPVTLENLWWIRQYPYSCGENRRLYEEQDTIIEEMKFFKSKGGGSVVENTTKGINRDLPFLQRVASESGVNIIAGSGYYYMHPPNMDQLTGEYLCHEMVTDITVGGDGTKIKCGVIGELGSSYPITENEKKVLRAAAAAQRQLECPVVLHPGRHPSCPEEVLRIFTEAGGILKKTAVNHIDRTIMDYGEIAEFAALGSYFELDLFGKEVSHYEFNEDFDMPSDADRIKQIKHLVAEGYEDKILVSQDVNAKSHLMKYGGHGYSHILLNVIPKMKNRGISTDVIDKITIQNPKQLFQF